MKPALSIILASILAAVAFAQSAGEQTVLNKVDTAFKQFTNYIWLKQSNYWNTFGHYWQGLPTIAQAPTNGEAVTPALLSRVASGHHKSWNDLQFPTNKTHSLVEIHEYAAPGAVFDRPPHEGWETNEPPYTLQIFESQWTEEIEGGGVFTNSTYRTNWLDRSKFGFVVILRVKPETDTWVKRWGIGPEDRNHGWRKEVAH